MDILKTIRDNMYILRSCLAEEGYCSFVPVVPDPSSEAIPGKGSMSSKLWHCYDSKI